MYTPRYNRVYFTGSQCQIYIGAALVDEAIEIEGTYDVPMYPIYGYKSQHFDTIAQGRVIAMGTMTINYVFDGYLYALMSKGSDGIGAGKQEPTTSYPEIVSSAIKPSDDYNKELLSRYEVEDELFSNTNKEIQDLRDAIWTKPNDFDDKVRPEFTKGPVKIIIKDFKLGYSKPSIDGTAIKESYEEKIFFDVFFTKYSTLRNTSAAPVAEAYQFIARTFV